MLFFHIFFTVTLAATLAATLVMSKLSFRWIVGDWSKAQIPDILLFTPYAIGVGVLFFAAPLDHINRQCWCRFLNRGAVWTVGRVRLIAVAC